jgi:hypothetical protein
VGQAYMVDYVKKMMFSKALRCLVLIRLTLQFNTDHFHKKTADFVKLCAHIFSSLNCTIQPLKNSHITEVIFLSP